MADKKLSFKQISIGYACATFTSVTTSAMFAQLTDWPMGETIGWSWLAVVGVPSVIVSAESLTKALGKKLPVQIISNRGQGRKVPINYANRTSHVFMSTVNDLMLGDKPVANRITREEPLEIPQSFTVVMDGSEYQVPITDMREFLHTAWQRQRQGKPAFSRNWWTKARRPKMHEKQHKALMLVLEQIPNLVLNRGRGRSGQLALPPEATVKTLQGLM